MRILYLNPCGQLGGAETSLLALLASVRAAQPDWELWLVLGEDGPLANQARDLQVNVQVVPFPATFARVGDTGPSPVAAVLSLLKASFGTARYVRTLSAVCKAIRPDIVHSNGLKMHVLGTWSRPRHVPIVWHIHDYVSARPLMSRVLRRLAGQCATAIVNSKSVAADLATVSPSVKIVSIYNAIDLRRYAPEGEKVDLDALAELSPGASDTVRVGLVGTFARWKGHKVFLEAVSKLPPNVRGYVIGGPIYKTAGSQFTLPELKQEAERLGLNGRLGFTGFLNDTAAAMRSLDVVVHASTSPEPFGMVIIEGMACERAVIASRAGGTMELFTEGENAVSHPPGNAEVLAEQLARLAGDASLRRRLGKNGRAAAEQFYGGDRLAREVVAVYRQVSGQVDSSPGELIPADRVGAPFASRS